MRKRKDELGMLVTREMGKIIAEGKGDVQEAIDFLEYIAGEGRRMFGETTPSELPSKFCLTFRQPIGIVASHSGTFQPPLKLGPHLCRQYRRKPATLDFCAATWLRF
jgi:hypothetical protein